VDKDAGNGARSKVDRRAAHYHVHHRLRAALGDRPAPGVIGKGTHPTGDGHDKLPFAPSNVVDQSFGNPKRPHRIDIQHLRPGNVIDIPGGLTRLAINAGAVDEHIVLEGAIRSKVNDGPATTYKAGQSFSELPGDRHGVSANASETTVA
jgi:hypothetical protein